MKQKSKKGLKIVGATVLVGASLIGGDKLSELEQKIEEPSVAVKQDVKSWVKSPVQLRHEKNGLKWYLNIEEELGLELTDFLRTKGINAIYDIAYMGDGKTMIPEYCGIYTPNNKIKEFFKDWYYELKRENYNPKQIYNDSPDDVKEIIQTEFGITHAKDKKPVLATRGLADCLGITGYNQKHKIGFLIHNDFGTSPISSSLVYHLGRLTEDKQKYEVHLIGELNKGIKKQVKKIIDSLTTYNFNKNVKFEIVEKDLYGGGQIKSRSIALDTRNGEIYNYNSPFDKSEDMKERLKRVKFGINMRMKGSPILVYFPEKLNVKEEGK